MNGCLHLHFFLKGVTAIKPQNQNSEKCCEWDKYLGEGSLWLGKGRKA